MAWNEFRAAFGGSLRLAALAGLLVLLTACRDDEPEEQAATPVPPPTAPATNKPPSIWGNAPSNAQVGEPYSFVPTVRDDDGDALTFSATNLPGWANLSSSSGRITGTPGAEGIYDNITISVSDGHSSARLGPFRITVAEDGSASAQLSWMPPTTNADGSTLADLKGYRIVYGRSATDLNRSIAISNPSINTYVVEELSPGTWYFSVIALNARSVESLPSSLGSKTIT